jgi:stearoyl-CoA desaturase (delta-9 desaturase)
MAEKSNNIIKTILTLPQLWGSIIPMQVIGLYAFFLIVSGSAPWWWWITTLVGYVCLKMIGIAAGYHRLFCHGGFKVTKFTKRVILLFGVLAGQGTPISWTAIHRGYHHRYPDQPQDLHSPRDGFWHSYMGWMFKYPVISARSALSLTRDPDILFVHKFYLPILWGVNLFLALIDINLWLYLLAFPAFVTLHCFLTQTSITHLSWAGYRNYEVNDDSVNVPWLFPIILGEAWHNNHHGEPKNPNYGGRHWWEFDPTYQIISILRTDK